MPAVEARSTTDTLITGPISNASLGVAFHGFAVPPPSYPNVVACTWGKRVFEDVTGLIEDNGATLGVAMQSNVRDPGDILRSQSGDRAAATTVRLEDGSEIHAEYGVLTSQTHSFGRDSKPPSYRLTLRNWVHGRPSSACLWAGRLDGGQFFNVGNLSLVKTKSGSRTTAKHGNMRLSGSYTWHLIDDGDATLALIDGAGPIDRDVLRRDLQALEFVAGAPIKLDQLTGFAADGSAVATIGIGFGFRPTRRRGVHDGPVPDRYSSSERWLPVLFSRLAKQPADRFYVALLVLSAYLDARVDHIDGAYLKEQIALEAFCWEILEDNGPTTLVKDSSAWVKWVTSQASAIQGHAIDDADEAKATGRRTAAQKLLSKVEAAQQAPATDAVAAAAVYSGLAWPKDLKDEVGKRSKVAHRYMMNKKGSRDIQADVHRRARLEVAIASMLARYIGYDGPIAGWQRDAGGWTIDPEWWPAPSDESRTEALQGFRCTHDVNTDHTGEPQLW